MRASFKKQYKLKKLLETNSSTSAINIPISTWINLTALDKGMSKKVRTNSHIIFPNRQQFVLRKPQFSVFQATQPHTHFDKVPNLSSATEPFLYTQEWRFILRFMVPRMCWCGWAPAPDGRYDVLIYRHNPFLLPSASCLVSCSPTTTDLWPSL